MGKIFVVFFLFVFSALSYSYFRLIILQTASLLSLSLMPCCYARSTDGECALRSLPEIQLAIRLLHAFIQFIPSAQISDTHLRYPAFGIEERI